jgi:hypothetical protein
MIQALLAAIREHLITENGLAPLPLIVEYHNGELAELDALKRITNVPAVLIDIESGVLEMQSQRTSQNDHTVELFLVTRNENAAAPTSYAALLDWAINACRGKVLNVSGTPVRLGQRFIYNRLALGRLWVGVLKVTVKEAGL